MGNAKKVGHQCMSQQYVVGSYQCAAEFGRTSSQSSLTGGEELELTLALLFNSFFFKVLKGFSV